MAGSQPISNETPRINSLQITTSTYGQVIPLVWGATRIPGNLLDYVDFKSTANTSTDSAGGKGGGGSITNTKYTYTVGIDIGLCEGPIEKIGKIWTNKAVEKVVRADVFVIPLGGSPTIKVTPPNNDTFDSDIGVIEKMPTIGGAHGASYAITAEAGGI